MRRNRSGRMGSGQRNMVMKNGESDHSGLHFENIYVGCPRPYIPLHERLQQKVDDHDTFFSLEFFPPRTPNGVCNFYTRVERYTDGDPLFIDITWHVAGDPANIDKCTSSTAVACGTLNFARTDVMLHMTAAQYSKEQTLDHVRQAHKMGIRNIMCLRGDLPPDKNASEYKYRAVDMIRWIKEEFGDDFTIACAGYPTGHPDASSYEQDLIYLKDKVDAGAHFIVTQLFFEVETFEKFVNDCRAIGINVPIIPGILPIMGYEMVKKLAQLSRLDIPEQIMKDLEPIKHDDDAILKYGKQKAIQMCRRLLHSGLAPGIHMYTMNREGVIREILKELRLWKERRNRLLPWEPHGINHPKRCEEDVRPIYWSCRPRSYIHRTQDWDGYPNGRWGNSSSPCFAALNEYYMFTMLSYKEHPSLLNMFGTPRCLADIKRVFECYVAGGKCRDGPGTEVRALPWSEDFDGVAQETNLISDQLEWCISRGVLTINSQPNVDGADSTDPTVGWGNPGGYVYQRAYIEFFCPLEMAEMIQTVVNEKYPDRVNFHCVNSSGEYERMNGENTTPIAVTWGVFPGREVAQPTVVDPLAFLDWKDEAFSMWMSNWASIYPPGSESIKVLKAVHDTYILFTMVDNDFKKNTVIFEIIKEAANNYDRAESSLGLGLDNYLAGLSLQNGHA